MVNIFMLPIFSVQAVDKAIILTKLVALNTLKAKPFVEAVNASIADQWINENSRHVWLSKTAGKSKLHHFCSIPFA